MCGIVGYIGKRECTPLLMAGLRSLAYRGYDSAGIAVIEANQKTGGSGTHLVRCRGKLENLDVLIGGAPPHGEVGIGHTRWAAHGRPANENAHPHRHGSVSVAHNGIIENYLALRSELTDRGHLFVSETDTEVVAHLIDEETRNGGEKRSLLEATRRALSRVRGAYAVVVISDAFPDSLIAARTASPLVLGLGEGECFVTSDAPAILDQTRRLVHLQEGDIAELSREGIQVIDRDGHAVSREPRTLDWTPQMADKDGYKHFMRKEIEEQPRAVTDTLRDRLSITHHDALLDGVELIAREIKKLTIIACGTSYYAGMVGKYLIEEIARVPVEVDLASEYRYRNPIIGRGDTLLSISQSGETADTLAAIEQAKRQGARVMCISNVVDSAIPRACHHALYTHAGPEIGLASTKSFTTQLAALVLIAIHLGKRTGALDEVAAASLISELMAIPQKMNDTLALSAQVEAIALRNVNARDLLFLGSGFNYPIALEGALKLKEISYLHAEGYAGGEMRHGPIALVDESVPVVVVATRGPRYHEVLANLVEVKARGGKVVAIATRGDSEIASLADEVLYVPEAPPALTPLLTVLPLQLLAYFIADLRGAAIDRPRHVTRVAASA